MLDTIITLALSSIFLAMISTGYLLFSSIKHHTRTGPKVKHAIEQHYKGYAAYALLRLGCWSTAIVFFTSGFGSLLFYSVSLILGATFSVFTSVLAGALFTLTLISYLFCHHLLYTPSLILLSIQIRFSRLNPLWRKLSPRRLRTFRWGCYTIIISIVSLAHISADSAEHVPFLFAQDLAVISVALLIIWLTFNDRKKDRLENTNNTEKKPKKNTTLLPNIIMIGTDTLRADRLGISGYPRRLTPHIDQLAKRSFYFSNCYVPLARTAPSLTSILTGCWPHHHKIRSNYPSASELELPMASIVKLLGDAGYHTAAVGDWAAADLGKIDFGFHHTALPDDQWNLKYLIKQGSAFIRLFLSLFTHNRLGKRFLPEIYYLAGIPLSRQTGRECRELISKYSNTSNPFFINYFSAAAHVPFGSDYPYYNLFSDSHYDGESRFLMTSFASPEEIIEKQGLSTGDFDVPQINNLYDGCIRQFDDEVGKILSHLSAEGLDKNTIVVIYSDHGADFFENGCWGQGNTLLGDDPSNRIPLIIFDPKREGGVTFSETARSIDIAPTLLDIIGLKTPPNIDGESLISWIEDPVSAHQRYSYQETGVWLGKIPGMRTDHITYPDLLSILDIPDKNLAMLSLKQEYYSQIIRAKDRCIRDDKWKLVYFPTTDGIDYQLFNMENDPHCTMNVVDKFPDVFIKYKLLLDKWLYSDKLM